LSEANKTHIILEAGCTSISICGRERGKHTGVALLKETGLYLWCCLSGKFIHNYDHIPSLESFKFEIVLVCRFTQNLSMFRRDINDSLKGPNMTAASVTDMMTS